MGNGRWTVWRLSIDHRCRAVLVAWTATKGIGSVLVKRLEPMLCTVATWLEGRVRQVTFLADRGFYDYSWVKLARSFGWDYAIRLPCSTTVTLADGCVRRIDELGVAAGKTDFFLRMRVTVDGQWRTHLAIARTKATAKQPTEIVAAMANRKANRRRLSIFLKRMQIAKLP